MGCDGMAGTGSTYSRRNGGGVECLCMIACLGSWGRAFWERDGDGNVVCRGRNLALARHAKVKRERACLCIDLCGWTSSLSQGTRQTPRHCRSQVRNKHIKHTRQHFCFLSFRPSSPNTPGQRSNATYVSLTMMMYILDASLPTSPLPSKSPARLFLPFFPFSPSHRRHSPPPSPRRPREVHPSSVVPASQPSFLETRTGRQEKRIVESKRSLPAWASPSPAVPERERERLVNQLSASFSVYCRCRM